MVVLEKLLGGMREDYYQLLNIDNETHNCEVELSHKTIEKLEC